MTYLTEGYGGGGYRSRGYGLTDLLSPLSGLDTSGLFDSPPTVTFQSTLSGPATWTVGGTSGAFTLVEGENTIDLSTADEESGPLVITVDGIDFTLGTITVGAVSLIASDTTIASTTLIAA